MTNMLLSWLLCLQLLAPAPAIVPQDAPVLLQSEKLWWGLIDPNASLWFSRLPGCIPEKGPVLWDFSWRGFLAAVFGLDLVREVPHALDA